MNYPNVDIFNNSPIILNRKTSSSVKIWILFLTLGLIVFIFIASFYKYHLYSSALAHVKKINSEYYLVTYIKEDMISNMYKYSLLIENERFKFKVVNISEEYYLVDNKNCYEVILEVTLKEQWKIENNILNIAFQQDKTTILQETKKGIKKWRF